LGAEYSGWAGTLSAVSTFFVIFFVSWLSTKISKKKAFYVATAVSIVGYGLKWVCYHPDYPLLTLVPAPFMAFGLGALFTLMGSMIADVCDMDELETGERREGMFGSIYWWVVKLGMAVALAAGGFLLNITGFNVALGGSQSADTILMVASAVAMWLVYIYPITEQKAHEIREELEKRRQAT
jgi:GPH family glycoside/pentoside/hexuronide:cation symporter